jgi:hypothetical protein
MVVRLVLASVAPGASIQPGRYVAGRDHPLRDPARRFLGRARSGDVEICLRGDLPGRPAGHADTDRARVLLPESTGLSVRDALHAAVMLDNEVTEIASFDEGFDRIPGIRRLTLP